MNVYERDDYWTVPADNGLSARRGDCEDYVLSKRLALISAGLLAETLSIALVQTADGEEHAVLLVATVEGEFVLDNLTSRIMHWQERDLVWRARQVPGNILEWIGLDDI